MQTFSALLAICERNSPVTGRFPSQRPGTRSFDVVYDLRLNKRLSKQSRRWWFEAPLRSLWRHCKGFFFTKAWLLPTVWFICRIPLAIPVSIYSLLSWINHCAFSIIPLISCILRRLYLLETFSMAGFDIYDGGMIWFLKQKFASIITWMLNAIKSILKMETEKNQKRLWIYGS